MDMNGMDVVDLQKARAEATERFLAVAEALKAEAGVKKHEIRKSLSGYATKDGTIRAPEGRTRKQLYILAHECGHIALGHFKSGKKRHREEYEAERYAHEALRRHEIAVPKKMTERAKSYVRYKIRQGLKRGLKKVDAEAAAWSGYKG